jgi:hypothetical protein
MANAKLIAKMSKSPIQVQIVLHKKLALEAVQELNHNKCSIRQKNEAITQEKSIKLNLLPKTLLQGDTANNYSQEVVFPYIKAQTNDGVKERAVILKEYLNSKKVSNNNSYVNIIYRIQVKNKPAHWYNNMKPRIKSTL